MNSLVENLVKEEFKYLGQELDDTLLDLVNQNDFILMNKWAILKGLKKNYQVWKGFIASWLEKKK